MDSTDRRRAARIPVQIPAEIFLDESKEAIACQVIDISVGGAFVHCTVPVMIGQEILLRIHLSKTEVLAGKVVELDKLPLAKPKGPSLEPSVVRWARGSSKSGFGVQFKSLSPEKRAFVDQLVAYFEEQEKLFG